MLIQNGKIVTNFKSFVYLTFKHFLDAFSCIELIFEKVQRSGKNILQKKHCYKQFTFTIYLHLPLRKI